MSIANIQVEALEYSNYYAMISDSVQEILSMTPTGHQIVCFLEIFQEKLIFN